jgi:hypothetical protein
LANAGAEGATNPRQQPKPDVDQTIDFNPFREARKNLCTTFGPFDPLKSIAAGNKGICKATNTIVGNHRLASMSPIGGPTD